jgi:hypothetical protein
MPVLTSDEDTVLKALLRYSDDAKPARTQQQMGCTRYRLLKLLEAKLVKRSGKAKNPKSTARQAITYELTAKGKKRAQRCSA